MHDRDLFGIIWGPTIAAMSVVFEHTDDEAVLVEVRNEHTCSSCVSN